MASPVTASGNSIPSLPRKTDTDPNNPAATPLPLPVPSLPQGVTRPADSDKVEMATRFPRGPMASSELAGALRDKQLGDPERDAIVQGFARGQDKTILFGETNSASNIPSEDRATIARSITHATSTGQLTGEDLRNISDENLSGTGAQRFLSLLKSDQRASDAGGPIEKLGQALQARAADPKADPAKAALDRAGAALAFTSSPELTSRNLNTPEARKEAFAALAAFNASAPYESKPGLANGITGPGIDPADSKALRADALGSAARLFAANAEELTNAFTKPENSVVPDSKPLQQFFGQTIFNPNAAGIPMGPHKDGLVGGVRDAVAAVDSKLAQNIARPADGDRDAAALQYGAFHGALEGGTMEATNTYANKLGDVKKAREEVSSLVSPLIGKLPVEGLTSNLGEVTAEAVQQGAKILTGRAPKEIGKAVFGNPSPPANETFATDLSKAGIARVHAMAGSDQTQRASLRSAYFDGLDQVMGAVTDQSLKSLRIQMSR